MIRCELCGDTAQHRYPAATRDFLVCDRCYDRLWDQYAGRQEP